MYKNLLRPLLFLFDPEKVHSTTFAVVQTAFKVPGIKAAVKRCYTVKEEALERTCFGLTFKNPVGLAAGFDKNATLYNELQAFGFGFIEIGTITPKAQEGNAKKRLFRLKADKAIINRMGLNNKGVEAAVLQLKKRCSNLIIGGNIGNNTTTPPEAYTKDYLECFNTLHPHVDYFTINISCPNVERHNKLSDTHYLKELIAALQNANKRFEKQKPILLKIAPDLNYRQLDAIIALVTSTNLDGVVACNTSPRRNTLKTSKAHLEFIGKGGLSGRPIRDKSTRVIKYLAQTSNKAFPIIGVGGIQTPQDALDKIAAGADLVQIYTGFIYEGPSLVKAINKALLQTL